MNVLLIEVLQDPGRCVALENRDWDILIPQARATGLLASLGLLLEDRGLLAQVPAEVQRHMQSVVCVHMKQCESLEYEVSWLQRAMDEIGERLVVLKGGAYILAGLAAGSGRLVSDIDMLVPGQSIRAAEDMLTEYGWESVEEEGYNERYYREWMHEIPPLAHRDRDSVLDVHHTILPPTSDEKLDPEKLFEALQEPRPGIFVLAPVDMVLHSATHLFHEGDFTHGLRDLLDLDRLMRQFAADSPDFWQDLVSRAKEMDMVASLHYAVRYCRLFFATPVPEKIATDLAADMPRFPGMPVMDFIFKRGFLPDHQTCTLPYTGVAHFCLYIRSHYLRMPLRLLLPHLIRKAWMGRFGQAPETIDLKHGEGRV